MAKQCSTAEERISRMKQEVNNPVRHNFNLNSIFFYSHGVHVSGIGQQAQTILAHFLCMISQFHTVLDKIKLA